MANKLVEVLTVVLALILVAAIFHTVRADQHNYYGGNPGGTYHGGGDPYHYSDVQNPPQFTIYRDSSRGYGGRGSDPYHYSDVQDPPQFTIYRDRRR